MDGNRSCAGNALVEFTLVGIPLIFVLISTFQMALAMWNYQTLAYAVRAGARYAATHGKDCGNSGNSCGTTVANVENAIAKAAVGLPPGNFNVTLTSGTATAVTCAPLSSCGSTSTAWPPSGNNSPGQDIQIAATYTFSTALGMLWPGAGKVSFGTFTFVAYTRQPIQF
jgi:Flp pilus assembly protein TadG